MNAASPDQPSTVSIRANAALIRYPRFTEVHREIRRCREMSKLAGEPHCLSLEGVPGAGKSTLVKAYATAFPRLETAEGTTIPVFYLETPSPVTIKGLAAVMLEQLGDPAAHRGPLWSINSRLVQLIIACEVELVILDDFHHLIDTETNRVLVTVSDWLKVLIKETGVPFLVVGIAGRIEPILAANAQLSRLFAARETLQPFPWEPALPATIQAFAHFVQYAERILDQPLVVPLPRVELLARLHAATDGVVANIMNLLRYAQRCAVDRGSADIELQDLGIAFTKRLAPHLRRNVNPFGGSGAAVVAPKSTMREERGPESATPGRRWQRKQAVGKA